MGAPDFWGPGEGGILSWALIPFGKVYGQATKFRLANGSAYKASIPVVCVGNLVAGGAGKTPVVMALLDYFQGQGIDVHVLSRGYGGSLKGPIKVEPDQHRPGEVGDEPLMIARRAPCWVSVDREVGAREIEKAGGQLILMDDGFQNPGLHKDFSFIVINGAYGFGNGRCIPAGPLRELPVDGLPRAQAVIMIGPDKTNAVSQIQQVNPDLPILNAWIEPGAEGERLRGQKVLAFAGMGHPEKFYKTLKDLGADVIARFSFGDHHDYKASEIERLLKIARVNDAICVTTTKDAIKLSVAELEAVEVLSIALKWEKPDNLHSLLAPLMA